MIHFMEGINNPDNLYKNYLHVGQIVIFGFFVGVFSTYPLLCLSVFISLSFIYACIYFIKTPYSDINQNYLYAGSEVAKALGMVLLGIIDFVTDKTLIKEESMKMIQIKWSLGWVSMIFFLISIFCVII
eukprot:GHVR01164581.1.p1 GENE.GHVR01164581.1~~GHVR01164581.1.p1  ORF type:complete len:129 (-),score=4.69 GHVR01164581.1:5432-5818(-)